MGFKELKERAKGFKQKTDKAVEDLKQPGLFGGKAVETSPTFECIRDPADAEVKTGDTVRLIDMRDRIEVFGGLRAIGYVVAAETFRSSVNLLESNGMAVTASVIEVSVLGPTFVVMIHK